MPRPTEEQLAARREIYGWRVCTGCGNNGPEPWHIIRNGGKILCDKCFERYEEAKVGDF